jgi:hypothetical protein
MADRSAAPVAPPKSRQVRRSWALVQRAPAASLALKELGAAAAVFPPLPSVSRLQGPAASTYPAGLDLLPVYPEHWGERAVASGAQAAVAAESMTGAAYLAQARRDPASVASRAQVLNSGRSPVRVEHPPRYWRAARWRNGRWQT